VIVGLAPGSYFTTTSQQNGETRRDTKKIEPASAAVLADVALGGPVAAVVVGQVAAAVAGEGAVAAARVELGRPALATEAAVKVVKSNLR
jgi:hypothetical protein